MFKRLASLARQSALYGIGSISAKLMAILLLPVYVRFLTPADYGAVETILTIDLMLAAFVRLGLQNSLMRFFYEHEKNGQRGHVVAQTIFWATFLSATIGSLALGLGSAHVAEWALGSAEKAHLVWIGAFGVWTSALYQTMTATYRLEKRAKAFLYNSLTNVALAAVLTLTMVVGFDLAAVGLLLGPFLAQFIMLVVTMVIQRRFVGFSVSLKLLRELAVYGIPTMPLAIANQGLRMVDRLVLTRMAGLTAVGLYGVGSRAAQVVMLVVVALQLSWQPFAYSIEDDDEAKRTYSVVMTWFVAGIGWLVAAAALTADPVIRWLTVPAFYEAADTVPLLTLAAGVYGIYFLAGVGAGRVKRTGYHIVIALIALATSIVANLLLVPIWGIMGAALASVLANLAMGASMVIRSQQVFPVDYDGLRILRSAVVIFALVGLAYALPGGEVWTWPIRFGLALCYPLLLLAVGWMPKAERHVARREIRRWRARRAAA